MVPYSEQLRLALFTVNTQVMLSLEVLVSGDSHPRGADYPPPSAAWIPPTSTKYAGDISSHGEQRKPSLCMADIP